MELMSLWQLVTMSTGKMVNRKWSKSRFSSKSAHELVSLMYSHSDQVDEPFQQFRQYGISLRGQKGTKTGVN